MSFESDGVKLGVLRMSFCELRRASGETKWGNL